MSDDPYQRFLDNFGTGLERASRRSTPRRRPAAALGGAIGVATAAVTAVLILGAGEDRLDAVAQARQALEPAGQIVHLVARDRVDIPAADDVRDGPAPPPTTTEQWSASDPTRWRIAFSNPDAAKTPGAVEVSDEQGVIVGPVQFAYGAGTSSVYYERRNTLTRVRGVRDQDPTAVPGPALLGADPVATIRGMLDRGELRDTGKHSNGARTVRRLVGEPAVPAREAGSQPAGAARVEYDVDADTYAPVTARLELGDSASGDARPAATIVVSFLTFERLTPTKEHLELLEIQPTGHPTVINRTAREAAAAARRAEGR